MRFLILLTACCALLAPATTAVTAVAKKTAKKAPARKASVPKAPPVSPQARAEASSAVESQMADAVELGIQNAAAMVPFYELMHRRQQNPGEGEPLRVLQFGDSHTASDDWPGELRQRFQQKFGDGGPGFTHAGRPFLGYRRYDSRGSMSRGWKTEGLQAREGDGLYGLSGARLTATRADETLTLEAEGEFLELFFLKEPGGGSFTLEDNDTALDTVSADGAAGAGYYRKVLAPGAHKLVLRTQSAAPVRVFGWVLEKRGGMTWETLGINGAQADLLLLWDAALLKSHIERRNPALVVLAYGTNEARRPDWTTESYRDALTRVIRLIREASPTTSILVIGAPDQGLRAWRRVTPYPGVDRILQAQREAALANGCAFWNLRAAMGGKGSMKQWVQAGLAQGDYVHLTTPGYRLVGDSLYELIMGQYGIFQTVRRQLLGTNDNGPSIKTH
jgi:lysophospholipase L1-like esterase